MVVYTARWPRLAGQFAAVQLLPATTAEPRQQGKWRGGDTSTLATRTGSHGVTTPAPGILTTIELTMELTINYRAHPMELVRWEQQ